MSEDREKSIPETDPGREDDTDVEAHSFKPAAAEAAAATEEGPDVEGHQFNPKAHPKAQP